MEEGQDTGNVSQWTARLRCKESERMDPTGLAEGEWPIQQRTSLTPGR